MNGWIKSTLILVSAVLLASCQTKPRSVVTRLPELSLRNESSLQAATARPVLTEEEHITDAALDAWCSRHANLLKLVIAVDDSVSKLPSAVARRSAGAKIYSNAESWTPSATEPQYFLRIGQLKINGDEAEIIVDVSAYSAFGMGDRCRLRKENGRWQVIEISLLYIS